MRQAARRVSESFIASTAATNSFTSSARATKESVLRTWSGSSILSRWSTRLISSELICHPSTGCCRNRGAFTHDPVVSGMAIYRQRCSLHGLRESQPVSIQIDHIELHHPVLLAAEWTCDPYSRQRRVFRIQPLHVIGDDVDVPRLALPPTRIIGGNVSLQLLNEYLDVVATKYRKP